MDEMYEIIDGLLKERGISWTKMSSDLGMSRSFMTEFRKGHVKGVTLDTAIKIADYFGVSLNYILGIEHKEDNKTITKDGQHGIENRNTFRINGCDESVHKRILSNVNLQNRIRELRKKKAITMKQLGAAVGLAENVISRYETGKRHPDNHTLLKLSEYFGVTIGYLLGAEQEITSPAISEESTHFSVGYSTNRIREARKRAGLKQTELACRLGISQGALSGWENGKYEPDSAGWIMLSKHLGVSVEYLMGVPENSFKESVIQQTCKKGGKQNLEKRNIVSITGQDGSTKECYLSEKQFSILKSIIDLLSDDYDNV